MVQTFLWSSINEKQNAIYLALIIVLMLVCMYAGCGCQKYGWKSKRGNATGHALFELSFHRMLYLKLTYALEYFFWGFANLFPPPLSRLKHGLVAYISHRSRSSKFLNFICVDKFLNWYLYFPIYVKIIYY